MKGGDESFARGASVRLYRRALGVSMEGITLISSVSAHHNTLGHIHISTVLVT